MRKTLAAGAMAAAALLAGATPASAATDAPRVASVASPAAATAVQSPHATTATTIGWDITRYSCNNSTGLSAQSRQAKNGPDVNRLVSVHQLQRFQGGAWRTLASRSYQKSFPANRVYYYAPGPNTVLSWNVKAYGLGDYRVNVVFRYFRGSVLQAVRTLNTQREYGSVCRVS